MNVTNNLDNNSKTDGLSVFPVETMDALVIESIIKSVIMNEAFNPDSITGMIREEFEEDLWF